ncbi:MAG: aspartate/glutamate racemase family protein [Treponema sp.]|nr:aspartate/glutamate racemase family protein [Treponema sp.]
MKKIGLVGGTGPKSTLMYYKELNSRIDKMTGGAQMPDLAIESVNFRRAWDYVSNGKYDSLTDYLSEKVEKLKAGGSEIIALTAATMHIVYQQIVQKTNVPLVSIPKSVCEEIQKKRIQESRNRKGIHAQRIHRHNRKDEKRARNPSLDSRLHGASSSFEQKQLPRGLPRQR